MDRALQFVMTIKLERLIALLTIAAVVVSSAVLLACVQVNVDRDAQAKAIERQELALRLATELLQATTPGISVLRGPDNGIERISLAELPDVSKHELVDSITRVTHGPATIFAHDAAKDQFVRISTTVKTANGNRAVGTVLDAKSPANAPVRAGRPYLGAADILGKPYMTAYFPISDSTDKVRGILFVGTPQDDIVATSTALVHQIAWTSLLLVAAMAFAGYFVSRMLVRPVPELVSTMRDLARDEPVHTVPYLNFKNEIGDMARAIAVFRDHAAARTQLEMERAAAHELRDERQKALDGLILAFKSDSQDSIEAVSKFAVELDHTAGALRDIAASTTDRVNLVAEASSKASKNVTTVAGATGQLTLAINEIAEQTTHALNHISSTSEMASATNTRMSDLAASAHKIGEVVTMIRDIAGQTNLLALNATIEAARAGEAGRGFAVVATEVKTLSARTAQATETISHQVEAIRAATTDAVAAMRDISGRMTEVNSTTSSIAAAVSQQGAATSEISESAQQTAGDTTQVNESISGVAEAAVQTSQSADRLLATSGEVSQHTRQLKARIETFLASVAAA